MDRVESVEPPEASGLPHVLLVGAGFAGMSALEELRTLPVEVTLLDRNLFHTFQPFLYQVATAGLNPGDVAYPARATVRQMPRTRFHLGELAGVEWEDRKAVLADGQRLAYDYLILALGASTNFFGIPGAEEHSLAIYTIPQAVHVRDHVFARLEERAACEPCTEPLRIVVVGGGPTGVEMAGTLAELRDALVGFGYPELNRSDVRVVLVEMQGRTLGAFDERLSRYAAAELERRGVELRLGQTVAEVREDEVLLSSGELLSCAVTIWAAGVRAPALAGALGLAQGRSGRIAVEADLRPPGRPETFVVGDLSAAVMGEGLVPQLAQPAIQEGRHAARQIGRLLEQRPTEPFVYHDKGNMATIGRRAAVLQLPIGVRLTGTLAWLGWLGLHIFTLVGRRNRLSTLSNLAWRYVRWPRGVKVIVGS